MSFLDKATEVTRIDSGAQTSLAAKITDYDAVIKDAADVTSREHRMGTWQTIKDHPTAIMWTMLFSLALVMEGYDTMLLSNFYAQPAFTKKFGKCNAAGHCEISSSWQSGLSNGAQVGEIIGLQFVGVVSERYGYKKTMLVSLVFMTAFVFIPFFARSLPVLLIGQILQGIPWGVFQTLTTTYAADIAPLQLRGVLTSYNNICWVIGQLIAQGILRACLARDDVWGYKIPYAIQWVWPAPILVAALFAPESPWWLCRQGRRSEAELSLRRLSSKKVDFTHDVAAAKLNEMMFTIELERHSEAGARYIDCFRGTNLRRTEIACMVYLTQQFGGGPLMGYATYFFQKAGLSVESSFDMSIGLFACGFVGTVSSWFVMQRVTRRSIFIWGQVVSVCILLAVGSIAVGAGERTGASWAIGALLLLFTFVYDSTVGPLAYALVAEMPASQVRAKTVALSRNAYNVGGIVTNCLIPRMLNPDAWNLGAKSGFPFAGTAFLWCLWSWARLPDPTGRTYLELDALFQAKVPAREFRKTRLELIGKAESATDVGAARLSEEDVPELKKHDGTSPQLVVTADTLPYQ